MHALAVADDRVHAQPSGARLPLARVFVIADAGHHLPRIPAIVTFEQRGGFDPAQQLVLAAARLDRPDIDECAPVVFRKCRRRFRFLEALAHIRRAQHFHPKNGLQLEAYNRGVPRASMSVEYTGTPGPNGPRSENRPRDFEASATNAPFLVPIISTTRSATVILQIQLGET